MSQRLSLLCVLLLVGLGVSPLGAATLVADYSFGNPANLSQDNSGNGYNGSVNGAAASSSVWGGGAITVGGGTNVVTGDLTPSFGSGTDISVATWFNVQQGGNGGVIVDELGQPTPNVSWHDSQIEYETNNTVNMSVWPYSGVVSSNTLAPGWHQAVLTFNSTTNQVTGYIDGSQIANGTSTAAFGGGRQTPFNNGGAQQYYGFGPQETTTLGNGQGFAGQIGRTQIYNGALSNSDVANSFSATAPAYLDKYAITVLGDNPTGYYRFNESSGTNAYDSSINGNTATYVNNAQINQPGASFLAPSFATGGTGYVNIPSAAVGPWATNPGESFEVVFKTTGSGVILGQNIAGGTVDGGNPGGWVPAMYVGSDGELRSSLFWHNGTGNIETDPVPVNDGRWHDAVVTYNNGTETLFVDGKEVAQQTGLVQSAYNGAGAGGYDYHLGVGFDSSWPAANGGWDHFNGSIDEASFYQYALSSTQVDNHFQAVPEPSSIVLLGLGVCGVLAMRRRSGRS